MKRIALLLFAFLLAAGLSVKAEDYVPRTTWPYIYKDFVPGKILTWKGTVLKYDKLNINLVDGRVHYVQDGVVMQADLSSVRMLLVGDDAYILVEGRMDRILKETDNGAVLLRTTIDVDQMNKADIGYGKSSLASTSGLAAFALGTNTEFSINRSLDEVAKGRDEGDALALREVTGLYFKNSFVPATRTDVLKIHGIDKNAVKQFIKKEKIKFGKVDDLARLLEYMNTL